MEGWRWVPVEATEEMVEAICRDTTKYEWPASFDIEHQAKRRAFARAAWVAALAAAPHPPIAPDADLASRLEQHARIHDEHVPYDSEQARWAADLRAAAAVVAHPPIAQPQAVDPAQQLPHAYLLEKLRRVMPMLQEGRDALTAITEAQRKLHGISASLADRMDAAGTYSLDDWQREQPLLPEPPKEGA